MHGAGTEEQTAASLHDIGHGPFSHVAEEVLEVLGEDVSYEFHEEIAHRRLDEPHTGKKEDSTLNEILLEAGFDGHQILNNYNPESGQSNFPLLERDKPDICADRWEYFIRDASFLTERAETNVEVDFEFTDLFRFNEHLEVANMYESNGEMAVRSSDRQFVMTDPDIAAKTSRAFIQMNRKFWWNPVNRAQSRGFAFAAAEAVEESGKSYEDFFRMDDAEAYGFVEEEAGDLLSDVERYFTQEDIEVVDKEDDWDFKLHGYEREGPIDPETGEGYSKTIDPLVKEHQDQSISEMKRASQYDEELEQELEEHEQWAAEDQYIRVDGFDFNRISRYLN